VSESSDLSTHTLSAVATPETICGPLEAVYGLQGDECVASEQDAAVGQQEAAAPVRAAGRRDDARPAGKVELVAVAVGHRVVDTLDEERAHRRYGGKRAVELGVSKHVRHPAALVVVARGMAGDGPFALVRVHRHTELAPDARYEPIWSKCPCVSRTAAIASCRRSLLEQLLQRVARAAMARVEDGQPVAVLDDVPVRVGVLDSVNAVGDGQVQHSG
jgi:hypothetical protein